ncbi:unnamed protein product [Rotaria sp. Silwood1]|nr:unnamed protein product [Rotaria sp. Silwood1]
MKKKILEHAFSDQSYDFDRDPGCRYYVVAYRTDHSILYALYSESQQRHRKHIVQYFELNLFMNQDKTQRNGVIAMNFEDECLYRF